MHLLLALCLMVHRARAEGPETSVPTTGDFEGLRIQLPTVLAGPTRVSDGVTTWQGEVKQMNPYNGMAVETYGLVSVVVTDLTKLPNARTEDQVLAAHEASARTAPPMVGQNFKTTRAKLGKSTLLVVEGTCFVPSSGGGALASSWVSFVFSDGRHAWEVDTVLKSGTDAEAMTAAIKAMTWTPLMADKAIRVTGYPSAAPGAYEILGVPFRVVSPYPLQPDPNPHATSVCADAYIADINSVGRVTGRYILCRRIAGEARTDTELLTAILGITTVGHPYAIPAGATMPVLEGSGTVEMVHLPDDYHGALPARVRFEHDGDWMAILVTEGPLTTGKELNFATLERTK